MRAYKLITAFGSPASLKTRAFLRWANVPVRETEASALVLKSAVRPRLKSVRVPVLVTPSNEALSDPRLIQDWIGQHEPGPSLTPGYGHHRFVSRLLESFADEVLSPATVFVSWNSDMEQATARMGASLYPDLDEKQQMRQARLLSAQLMHALDVRGFGKAEADQSRSLITSVISILDRHFENNAFILGNSPCHADFAIFGALAILRETPATRDMLAKAENVRRWLAEVNAPFETRDGDFRKAYTLPESLNELVMLAAEHFLPQALEACDAVADWADCNPGNMQLPATLSAAKRSEAGQRQRRGHVRAEAQWLLQRLLEMLGEDLPRVEAEARDELLLAMGYEGLKNFEPERTVLQTHHVFRVDLRTRRDSGASHQSTEQAGYALMKAREAAGDSREFDRVIMG